MNFPSALALGTGSRLRGRLLPGQQSCTSLHGGRASHWSCLHWPPEKCVPASVSLMNPKSFNANNEKDWWQFFYSNDSHNWIILWEKTHPLINKTICNQISLFKLGFQVFFSESYILVTPEVKSLRKCAKTPSSVIVCCCFVHRWL